MRDLPDLIVEDALTATERSDIRKWWDTVNPHYAGAPVADLLDMLGETDSWLHIVEPWWEQHGEKAGEYRQGVLGVALLAAIILLRMQEAVGPTSSLTDKVFEIAERTRR